MPVNGTAVKVSAGGAAYVPVCQVNSLEAALNELKKKGYQIASTVCEKNSFPKQDFNFNSPLCLIFGNEHGGIRPPLLKKSDYALTIPLRNHITSLNVSVSCGIILTQIVSGWENKHSKVKIKGQ